jgi:allophanate hydrolase
MPLTTADLTLPALRSAYAAGALTPTALCQELLPALAASRSVFITKAREEDIYERCRWAGQGWQQRTAVAATATADGLPSPARLIMPFASSVRFRPRRQLEALPAEQRGPLWGVPFAVKDNIDVAGVPTTAACPDFIYVPTEHARAVQPLFDAGKHWTKEGMKTCGCI